MIDRSKIIKYFDTEEFALLCKTTDDNAMIEEDALFLVYRQEWYHSDKSFDSFDLLETKVEGNVVSLREIKDYDNAVVIVAEVPTSERNHYIEL